MPCHFYILYSSIRDRYYTGHTCAAIHNRIGKHNSNHKRYTGKVKDWKLVLIEQYPTKEEAYAREREVKAWKSRIRIERLIEES